MSSLSLTDWERYDSEHPAPTFFGRPMWARALEAEYPTLVADAIRIARPGESDLIVPAMRMANSSWLQWRRLYAMPFGFYGTMTSIEGQLADQSAATGALESLIDSGVDSLEYTQWPMSPISLAPTLHCKLIKHEASVIDLRNGAAVALARFKGSARRMVGQSDRRGVTCAPASAAEGLDAYYAILVESTKRWNLEKPPFSRRFLAAILQFGGSEAELWLVRHAGEVVAGGVVLYGATELFFLTAAMRAEFGWLRPSNALNAALIRVAADRGMLWYNLGASEGIPTVARFKASLGATQYEYATLKYESRRLRAYVRLRTATRPLLP